MLIYLSSYSGFIPGAARKAIFKNQRFSESELRINIDFYASSKNYFIDNEQSLSHILIHLLGLLSLPILSIKKSYTTFVS